MRTISSHPSNPLILLIDKNTQHTRRPDEIVVHWDEFDVPTGQHSLPREVNSLASEFKSEYLEWLSELPKRKIRGIPLAEHLKIEDSLSFWWFTLISEKSPLKSPGIYDVFRLRAFEQFCEKASPRSPIIYFGARGDVHRTLSRWCKSVGRKYEWRLPLRHKVFSFSGVFPLRVLAFPFFVQAMAYLLRFIFRFAPLFLRPTIPSKFKESTLVVTYFPNVDKKALDEGVFRSNYWGALHDVFDEMRSPIQWVWLLSGRGEMTARQVLAHRDRCNKKGAAQGQGFFVVQEFLTLKRLLWVIRRYVGQYLRGLGLSAVREEFRLTGSQLNFYPILAYDWKASIFGHVSLSGYLWIALFAEMAERLNFPRKALYVWENQPWEMALLHALREQGCEKIIGCQHSILPPLLLRSFDSSNVYKEKSWPLPQPDMVVTTGEFSHRLLAEQGFPDAKLKIGEALRYQYLSRWQNRRGKRANSKILLVTTGFLEEESGRQLGILQRAMGVIGFDEWKIWVKAHPFAPSQKRLGKMPDGLSLEQIDIPVSEALSQVDAAFIANASTIAVESLYAGVPTAVHVSPDEMNLSPLYGYQGVAVVSTVEDLVSFLRGPQIDESEMTWFQLNPALSRWRDLLAFLPSNGR